jgi:hypothetical protein
VTPWLAGPATGLKSTTWDVYALARQRRRHGGPCRRRGGLGGGLAARGVALLACDRGYGRERQSQRSSGFRHARFISYTPVPSQ